MPRWRSSRYDERNPLIPPPAYAEVARNQQQQPNHSYRPVDVHNINPTPTVPINGIRAGPNPRWNLSPSVIITAMIVCGIVTIVFIISLATVIIKHNQFITTTIKTTTTTTTTASTTTQKSSGSDTSQLSLIGWLLIIIFFLCILVYSKNKE